MTGSRVRGGTAAGTAAGTATTVLALVVLLGACGSSGGGSKAGSSSTTRRTTTTTATTPSTTTTAPPSTRPPSTTAPCSFTGTTTTSQQTATVAGNFRLRSVNVAPGACTDTVTFGFASAAGAGAPPYEISLVSPPFAQAASGEPITLPGRTFLKVRFSPAWTYDVQSGAAVYSGPNRIEPTGTAVTRALVMSDASEGVVTWLVGMDGSGAYRVSSAASPASVTVTVGR